MLAVHDVSVRGVVEREFAEHGRDVSLHGVDEAVVHLFVDEHVVGRDAGLAAIEVLAEHDASGRELDIGVGGHDAGALAAELERDGRQMRRRFLHDELSDRRAAGEEDVVETLLEQGGVFGAPALDDERVAGVEGLGHDVGHDLAGGGGVGARLHQAAVARRDRADQRLHREHEGVVPRRHDQHDAVGLGHGEACRGEVRQVGAHAFRLGPAAQVSQLVAQLGQRESDFAHIAFLRRLSEVGRERLGDARLGVFDGLAKPDERVDPFVDVDRGARREMGAQPFDGAFDGFLCIHAGLLRRRRGAPCFGQWYARAATFGETRHRIV